MVWRVIILYGQFQLTVINRLVWTLWVNSREFNCDSICVRLCKTSKLAGLFSYLALEKLNLIVINSSGFKVKVFKREMILLLYHVLLNINIVIESNGDVFVLNWNCVCVRCLWLNKQWSPCMFWTVRVSDIIRHFGSDISELLHRIESTRQHALFKWINIWYLCFVCNGRIMVLVSINVPRSQSPLSSLIPT